MALVLHHSRAKGSDKLLLLGIANHCGDGGAWPTIETLAKYTNLAERSVQEGLRRLERMGELATYRQAGGTAGLADHQRPNRYEVLVSCPAGCDRTANHRVRTLPTAQADLWTDGVRSTAPGEADRTRGVTPTAPGGVRSTAPKPSPEPTFTPGSQDSDHSARANCAICQLPFDQCMVRERTSGHTYTPALRDPAAVVGRVRSHYSDALGDAS